MKKKILMVMAIAILSFIPFANVYAEGQTGQTEIVQRTNIVLEKESTVYAGEIFVDGQSQMRWLYSPNISNTKNAFGNLKAKLYETSFFDLVPELDDNSEINGLSVSSDHQSEMNSNWTSASYVANQYFTGNISSETNEPLNCNDGYNKFLTVRSIDSNITFEIIEGVLTKVHTLNFYDEETTINYTKVDITTTPSPTYTVIFDANGGTPTTTQSVEEGSKATIPADPTRDGYEFAYWTSNTGINVSDDITSDTTFTAEWIRKFNIIEGPDQIFYWESGKDITIVSDGPFDEFDGFALFSDNNQAIYMDDLTEGKDYALEEGSTKLTLKNSFLKSLEADKYYVEFYYNNPDTYGEGYTNTTLLINEGNETVTPEPTSSKTTDKINNPQTGDNILFYISILGLSIIGLAGTGLYVKKFN